MKNLCTGLLLLTLLCPGLTRAEDIDSVQIESEVFAVLDEFIRSFSAKDPVAHIATYHFPHFRLARGVMSSMETAEIGIQVHTDLFKTLPDTGWYKSVWISRQIINMSDSKVHVNTRFRRLREDGTEIGTYNSLYILIKQDGRWGVKMRSSFL